VAAGVHSARLPRAPALAALLALGALLLYARSATFQFTSFDDARYLTENPHVRSGLSWANAAWAFSALAMSNWHPLTWLSHQLDAQLFGLNPGGHHLLNAAFHAANAALLFLALARMTGAQGRSALVAALFAVHPLHVESVAWVAERKDVLSTFFGMLALLCYARYAERPAARRYALVVLCFALSLLAKPMWVTLPFLLLLLDCWPLQRLERAPWTDPEVPALPRLRLPSLLREKAPLLALSIGSSIVTVIAQDRGGSMTSLEATSIGARLANAAVAYARYLGKTVWPSALSPYYPWEGTPPAWQVLGALILLVAITTAAFAFVRARPWLMVGWLWFLGTLVPVIGLVQVGSQSMADRYAYLPLVGLSLAVVWTVRLADRARVPVAAAVLIALSALTWRQEAVWFDQETLFRHAVILDPSNGFAHGALADGLRMKGRLDEARTEAEEAVRLNPTSSRHRNNLGVILLEQHRLPEALDAFARAVRLDPKYIHALVNLGDVALQTGELEMASGALGEALRLAPDEAKAHRLLGATFERTGDADAALREYREAVRLQPDSAAAWSSLAVLCQNRGDLLEARQAFEAATRADPGNFATWRNLGVHHARAGRPADAAAAFQRALALRPGDADVHRRLGEAQSALEAQASSRPTR
jgi:Tfp pilus assembly protein PilF